MKTKYLLMMLLAGSCLLLQSYSGENAKYPSGSPGGYTNSPADAKNCTNCHGGSAVPVTGWITSNIPASGYYPGYTYTITVTATGTGKKGFEVSPQTQSGALVGTIAAGTSQHLVNGNKAVTHSSSSSASTVTYNFSWTAPAAGTGDVTFYGSIIVGKSNTKTTTMVVSESTTGVNELENGDLRIFPNPVHAVLNLSGKEVSGVSSIRMYALDGHEVKLTSNTGAGEILSFNLEQGLAKGIYLLNITNGNKQITRKVVVE